jgi:hypothetical protein
MYILDLAVGVVCLLVCASLLVADARLGISLLGWIPAFLLRTGARSLLFCCRGPWWIDCGIGGDRGRFNKRKDFAGSIRPGVNHVGCRGDGLCGLLRRPGEGRYRCCLSSSEAGWSSSGWWLEGGGSDLKDPGCDGALGCFPADVPQSFYRLRVGRAPYAASKACWAMVLHRVHRRRRSPAVRGVAGGCRLTRDRFVIFVFFQGLSAMCSTTCDARLFERVLVCGVSFVS